MEQQKRNQLKECSQCSIQALSYISRNNAPKLWLFINSSIFISSLTLVIYNKRHYDEDLRQLYLFYNVFTVTVWCIESLLDFMDAKMSSNNHPRLKTLTLLILLISIFFVCQSVYMLIVFKTKHLSSDMTFDGLTNTFVYAYLTFQSIKDLRRASPSAQLYRPIPDS
jgi:hypothetical protein